ncbi:MAG: FAD binding domain-containing protein [Anaerolineae bacterium]
MATSVQEALGLLVTHRGQAQIIAGGARREGTTQPLGPCCLVDVSQVGALRQITERDGQLMLGGSVTYADILKNELAARGAPLLVSSAEQDGPWPVPPAATLAGTIVAAEGSSLPLVALVTLGAQVEITNVTGAQRLPLSSLFVRSGVSRVDSRSEIVTGIFCPLAQQGQGSALATIGGAGSASEVAAGNCVALVVGVQVNLAAPDRIGSAHVAFGAPQAVAHELPEAGRLLANAALEGGALLESVRASLSRLLAERVMVLPAAPESGAVMACALRALDAALAAALREPEA